MFEPNLKRKAMPDPRTSHNRPSLAERIPNQSEEHGQHLCLRGVIPGTTMILCTVQMRGGGGYSAPREFIGKTSLT